MVERVALASCGMMPCLCQHRAGFEGMDVCLYRARKAIEAMREPTDAMVKGSDWVRPMYDDPIPSPTEYYQAMIDEILK